MSTYHCRHVLLAVTLTTGCGLVEIGTTRTTATAPAPERTSTGASGRSGAPTVARGPRSTWQTELAAARNEKNASAVLALQSKYEQRNEVIDGLDVAVSDALVEIGDESALAMFLERVSTDWKGCNHGCAALEHSPKDIAVPLAKRTLLTHDYAKEDNLAVVGQLTAYLSNVGALSSDVCPAVQRAMDRLPAAALALAATAKCAVDQTKLKQLFASDQPEVRRMAVWVAGELGYTGLVPSLRILRASDTAWDDSCACHPVRDGAVKAIAKLTVAR